MDFSDITNRDGKLYAVSQNGINYLFHKKIKGEVCINSGGTEHKHDYDIAVTIYTLAESGFYFVKRFNVLEEINTMVINMKDKEIDDHL